MYKGSSNFLVMRMNETSCSSLAVASQKLGDFLPVLLPLPVLVQVPDMIIVYISLSREEEECYIGDNSRRNKKYMRITFLISDPKGRRKKSNSHIFQVAKAFIAYVTRI